MDIQLENAMAVDPPQVCRILEKSWKIQNQNYKI